MNPADALNDDAYFGLPKMPDYIAHHIDRHVSAAAMQDHKCLICQEDFDSNSDVACSTNAQDTTVVRLPPCNHLFHAHCILTWLDSTASARNSCPTCRMELCRLNVLSSTKVAGHRAELVGDRDAAFSVENYAAILAFADEQFALQGLGDKADYCHIPRIVRDFWEQRGNTDICAEHRACGLRWVEMIAANRTRERMEESDVSRTWSSKLFFGMFTMLMVEFAQMRLSQGPIVSSSDSGSTVADGDLYQDFVMGDGDLAASREHAVAEGQDATIDDRDNVLGSYNTTPDAPDSATVIPDAPATYTANEKGEFENATAMEDIEPSEVDNNDIDVDAANDSDEETTVNDEGTSQPNQWVATPRLSPARPTVEPVTELVVPARLRVKSPTPPGPRRSVRLMGRR